MISSPVRIGRQERDDLVLFAQLLEVVLRGLPEVPLRERTSVVVDSRAAS